MMRTRLQALILLLLTWFSGLAGAASYTGATVAYSWISPASHTNVTWTTNCSSGGSGNNDDAITALMPLGFTFTYGGTAYTQVYIQSNGRLQFSTNRYCGNATVPSSNLNTSMYPVSGLDLDPRTVGNNSTCPSATCYVRYATIGSAGSRQFVVSFVGVPLYGVTNRPYTFQIILNEADGSFVYQYGSLYSSVTPAWQLSLADYASLSSVGSNSARQFTVNTAGTNLLAWYKCDESAWSGSGSMSDSSGNGANASPIGSITSVPGYICNGVNIPANTTSAAISAVSTPFTLGSNATLRSGGTITLWWKPSLASGTVAQILDATTTSSRWFYLSRRNDNRLYFKFTDSNNSSRTVTASSTYAVGTQNAWYHIAVSWSFISGTSLRMTIWVNGTLAGSTTLTSGRTLNSSIGSLHVGDNRSSIIDSSRSNRGTAYSAAGVVDEVHVYGGALNTAQINADRTATHACTGSFHHLRIEHDGNAGTCAPENIVVKACANAACTAPHYTGGDVSNVNLTPTGSPHTWTPASPITILAANGGVATVQLARSGAGTTTLGTTGTPTPSPSLATECYNTATGTSGDCVLNFLSPNLTFDVPNHTAATRQIVTLTACSSAFANQTRSFKFWTTYTNPATGTLQGTIIGGTGNADCSTGYSALGTSSGAPTTVSLTFGSGTSPQASFSLCYPDVGLVKLDTRYDGSAGTGDAGVVVVGNDSFVAKPESFAISNIIRTSGGTANPGAADATGAAFVSAGDSFTTTVTAKNHAGATTPNYGRESPTAEGVKLTQALVSPVGGAVGSLSCMGSTSPCIIPGSEFGSGGMVNDANGVATVTDLKWSDVGVITLTPTVSDADYLGAGDVDTPTVTGNIGRFRAHHFALVDSTLQARSGSTCWGASAATRADFTSGDNTTIVLATEPFAVGDQLLILGVGSGGADLRTTVTSVVPDTDPDNNQVTLADTPATTLADAPVFWLVGYSYLGEAIHANFQVEPRNAAEGALLNYITDPAAGRNFAKFGTTTAKVTATGNDSWGLWAAVDSAYGVNTCRVVFDAASPFNTRYVGSGCPASPAYPLAALGPRVAATGTPELDCGAAPGICSFDADIVIDRMGVASGPDGPFRWLGMGVLPQDSDGAVLQAGDKNFDIDGVAGADRARIGVAELRFGRMRAQNAYGSEMLALPVPLTVESYSAASGWAREKDDVCTGLSLPATPDSCPATACVWGDLSLDKPTRAMTVAASAPSLASLSGTRYVPMAGNFGLKLGLPGAGKAGSVRVVVEAPTYLKFNWGSGAYVDNPTAVATFGTKKSQFIFMREGY